MLGNSSGADTGFCNNLDAIAGQITEIDDFGNSLDFTFFKSIFNLLANLFWIGV